MYKKFIFSFLLFSFFTIFAEKKPCFENACDENSSQGVLPSTRECLNNSCEKKSSTLLFDLDFIYFKTEEDGFEIATQNIIKNEADPESKINIDGEIRSLDFDFTPGFKLRAGFIIPDMSWDLSSKWMRLYSTDKNYEYLSKNNLYDGFIPFFYNPNNFSNTQDVIRFSKFDYNLKFHFNSLDIEMGDSFYVSEKVSFRIHGGIKGAVIHQKLNTFFEDGNTIQNIELEDLNLISNLSEIKIDSKGVGPRKGLNSKWRLKKSDFSLFTNCSLSFLLTKLNIHYFEQDKAYNTITLVDLVEEYKTNECIWLVRPVAELTFGLDWNKYFGKDKNYNFGIKAAYEMQYFWKQNLSKTLIDNQAVGLAYPNKGDLYLHGVVLGTHFEF
jgi:hypothetical protein